MHLKTFNGLYAITDTILTPQNRVLSQIERVLNSGVKIIQFRDKNSKDIEVEAICRDLKDLIAFHKATFILNDRVELVKKLNIDGVHIGKNDITPDRAREILGKEKIIGLSCYNSLELAKKYQDIVDYVAFGAFFSSSTKPNASKVDLNILKNHNLKIPVCAIGGINSKNISLLKEADMFAVISSIFKDDKIESNIEALLNSIRE